MRSPGSFFGLLVLGLLSPGCDDPVTPPLLSDLPRNFRLTGTATGRDSAGLTATCSLDLQFELPSEVARTPQRVDYEGVHGGEVERSVLARDGSGFAFHADVYGEVEAHLFVAGSVEIVIPVNRTAEGRFWQNLARFTGTVDSTGRAQGLWTCAPFDIDGDGDGYVDETILAEGIWQTEPQEPQG
jgi:hypothetical protein